MMVSPLAYVRLVSSQERRSAGNATGRSAARVPQRYSAFAASEFAASDAATAAALERSPAKFRVAAKVLVRLFEDDGCRSIASHGNFSEQPTVDLDTSTSVKTQILLCDAIVGEATEQVGPTVVCSCIAGLPEFNLAVGTKVADVETCRKTVTRQLAGIRTQSVKGSSGQETVIRHGISFADVLMGAHRLDQELSASTVRRQDLEAEAESAEADLEEFALHTRQLEELKFRPGVLKRKPIKSVDTLDVWRSARPWRRPSFLMQKCTNHPPVAKQPARQRLLLAVAGCMLVLVSAGAPWCRARQPLARAVQGAFREALQTVSPAYSLERCFA